MTLGRQYSSAVSDVSLFDGALLEVAGTRLLSGAFAGTQPDVATMRFSTQIREYGAYVGARDAAGAWTVTTGAIGSYDGGQLNREFLFTSASWTSDVVSARATQEVDYNRGWKQTPDRPSLSPTGTLLTLNVRVLEPVRLHAGYDSRRAVRLYRNYVTPEISFDDAFRTGVWGGVSARLTRNADVQLDVRRSTGGGGDAEVYSASASAREVVGIPLSLRARGSRFLTSAATGWLQSATLGMSPLAWLQVDITGGSRSDVPRPGTASAAVAPRTRIGWLELSGDVALGRSWYAMLTLTRDSGGWESSDQLYTALTYRF